MGRTEVNPDVWCKTKLFPLLILSKSTLKLLREWAWGKVSHIETHNHITHFNIQLKCFIFFLSMVCQNAELLYESSGKVQFLHFATILSICRIPRKCLGQSNYSYPWLVMFQCRLFYMEIKSLWVTHTVPNSCINIILFVVPLISERWVSKNHRNLYPFICFIS